MVHHNLKLSGGGKRTATAYAGQILLEDTMSHFELGAATDRLLPASGSNRGYKPSILIRQLMHLLHSGGRRLEDLRRQCRCARRNLTTLGQPFGADKTRGFSSLSAKPLFAFTTRQRALSPGY